MILYRLLRSDEDPSHAKDPWSPTSIEKHVTRGSHGVSSRYISCSKSLSAIEKFASMSKTSPKRLVKIETRTGWSSIHPIDLTDAYILEKYFPWKLQGKTIRRDLPGGSYWKIHSQGEHYLSLDSATTSFNNPTKEISVPHTMIQKLLIG